MNRFARCAFTYACAVASLAAQWGWSLRSPIEHPPGRSSTHIAYDLGRGVTVMFGGAAQSGTLADTWVWNGSIWTQRQAPGPSTRVGAAFGYDLARGRIVMFGGHVRTGPSGGLLVADTWEFDGARWTQIAVTGPSARESSAMAYDPVGNRMLLFGGGGATAQDLFRDTWAWNGTTWQQLAPMNAPTPRRAFGLATDFNRQQIVLHGGDAGGIQPQSDTWAWNGSDWLQLVTVTNPGPASACGLAFDWSRGVVVRFGAAPTFSSVSETWLLYRDMWILDPAATRPTRRTGCPITYDVGRNRLVLFGGLSGSTVLSDTWEYSAPPIANWEPHGIGCAGNAGTPRLAVIPGTRPVIGRTLGLELTGVRDGPMLFATGFSTTTWLGASLPAPLDALGMPGCTLLGSVDQLGLATATFGRAMLSLPVPNVPGLAGMTFVNQALAADPGFNAFGAVVSNAGIGVIGVL